MRVVALSDTHGRHRDLHVPLGDLLVHCGDFTNYGGLDEVEEFFAWWNALPHRNRVLLPGNHDAGVLDRLRADAASERSQFLRPRNTGLLQSCGYLYPDEALMTRFSVWGSPAIWIRASVEGGRASRHNAQSVNSEEELAAAWARLGDHMDIARLADRYILPAEGADWRPTILVTHCPPLGVLDLDGDRRWGSSSLLKFCQQRRPLLHLFGHVHGQTGSVWATLSDGDPQGQDAETTVHANVACCGRSYTIDHQPSVFDVNVVQRRVRVVPQEELTHE